LRASEISSDAAYPLHKGHGQVSPSEWAAAGSVAQYAFDLQQELQPYAETAKRTGAPDQVRQPRAEWLHPVLTELQATLGPNFDPVTGWLGRLDHVLLAGPEHKQQKWWSEALGRKAMERLLEHCSPRDLGGLNCPPFFCIFCHG
jgi:hypothetical protein